jgi:hypothetical protein
MVLMVDTDMIWFNKKAAVVLYWRLGYYHKEHSLICLEEDL